MATLTKHDLSGLWDDEESDVDRQHANESTDSKAERLGNHVPSARNSNLSAKRAHTISVEVPRMSDLIDRHVANCSHSGMTGCNNLKRTAQTI